MISNLLTILAIATQIVFAKGDGGYSTFRIPAIVQAANGDLLAFAEARKDSGSDTGNIDLVMRRSSDNGASWGGLQVVWDDAGNTCGNPSPVVDAETGRVILLTTWNDGQDSERAIRNRTSGDTRRVFVLVSEDDGASWSAPREITQDVKQPDWTWYATGPCHAIQLRRGQYKGRIVVPCDHAVFGGGDGSHIIYSDDAGVSWHLGGMPGVGNESTVCEIGKGRLLLNMRDARSNKDTTAPWRWVSESRDGGLSFIGTHKDCNLPEPVCQGSLASVRNGRKVYFCNPASETARTNMTLRFSTTRGKTWKIAVRLPGKHAAYSDLCILPDGRVAVLYESGENTAYDTIVFTVVTLPESG
jgi:sialidase-1